MASNPEVHHRFVFHIGVDDPAEVGPAQIKLHDLGFNIIGCDVVADVPVFRTRGPGSGNGTGPTIRRMIAESDDTVFTAKGIREIFRAQGRPIGGINYALEMMVRDGKLQKTGAGTYRKISGLLTHSPTPAAAAEPEPPRLNGGHKPEPKDKTHRYEVPNFQLILNFMKNKKSIATQDLHDLFKAEGRPVKSYSSLVNVFVKRGLLKWMGRGEYEVIAPKVRDRQKGKGKQTPSTNGDVAQHG